MKHITRLILQVDLPAAANVVATAAKRANRLKTLAAKPRGAKLHIKVSGLISAAGTLRSLDLKDGPKDKTTGLPKYTVMRLKCKDGAKQTVAPAVEKEAKPVLKRRARHKRHVKQQPEPSAPVLASASNYPVTSALATELADSAAPSNPSAASKTHATARTNR